MLTKDSRAHWEGAACRSLMGSATNHAERCPRKQGGPTQSLTEDYSLVLQVKDALAFLLVPLLVFCHREAGPSGKLTHGTLA